MLGRTCDSSDVLPAEMMLLADIDVAGRLEFGCIDAYSPDGRTDFNGHHIDIVVGIEDGTPPSA